MIAFNSKKVNILSKNDIKKYENDINKIHENINNITSYSKLIEVTNITKTNNQESDEAFLYYLKKYEEEIIINSYSDYKCPQCNHDNCLHFHKMYPRDLIVIVDGYEITMKIFIVVLECNFCKKNNKGKQHYHALLPDFLFPYHIYSSKIIIDALSDRIIKELKLSIIIDQINITHQLFYKWLRELKEYLISSSIILKVKVEFKEILTKINLNRHLFYYLFYENYKHPFFLFRLTCVPLALIP